MSERLTWECECKRQFGNLVVTGELLPGVLYFACLFSFAFVWDIIHFLWILKVQILIQTDYMH